MCSYFREHRILYMWEAPSNDLYVLEKFVGIVLKCMLPVSRSLVPVIVLNTLQAHGLSCFSVAPQSRAVHVGTSHARGGKPCVHEIEA